MNTARIFLIVFLTAFGVQVLMAQQALLTSGGTISGSGGTLSYSVGQVAYSGIEGSGGSLIQGMQLPFEFYVVGLDEYHDISLSMIVFPNPTSGLIKLTIDHEIIKGLQYQLHDSNGKLLLGQQIVANETVIAMGGFPPAIYFLYITHETSILRTFKIIKN